MSLPATWFYLLAAALAEGDGSGTPTATPEAPSASLTLISSDPLPLCLSAESLRDRVQSRLGRTVFATDPNASPNASGLIIDIHLALWKEPTWDVEMSITQRDLEGGLLLVGRRNLRLKADACEDLLAPLVFIVTLTIDPNAAQRPEPQPPAPKSATPPPTTAISIATQSVPTWEFSLGAGIGSGWGTVPNLSGLGHLRLMVFRQGWPAFALHLGYQRSNDVFHDTPPPRVARVSFSATHAGLELLPRIWRQIYLLAAMSCHTVATTGAGFDRGKSSRTLGCSTGAGALALIPVTNRASFLLRTEVALPWQRAEYTFQSSSGAILQGYRSSPIALTLVAGLSYLF
jgi:hypothetical protein